MKKEPKTKIDLSSCFIGQEVRLRDGKFTRIKSFETVANQKTCKLNGDVWVWNNGRRFSIRNKRSDDDVVEIIPAKKTPKTATHMGQKVNVAENRTSQLDRLTSAFAKIAFKGDNDLIRKAVQALEALL